jgi:lysophospholipase L1-like esterase
MTRAASAGLRALIAGLVAIGLWSCQPAAQNAGAERTIAAPSETLRSFFQALADLESGRRSQPVVIVQLGDSHTAGDVFSGRLRELFQRRFGDAGRGYLAPGVPFDYYRPADVEASQSEGWEVANSLRRDAVGPFGIAGHRVETDQAGETMRLSHMGGGFAQASILVLRQPDGGSIEVLVDGESVGQVDTAGSARELTRIAVPIEGRAQALSLRTVDEGAPVDVLGWSLEERGTGIVYDALGVGGATISVVGNWDPTIVAEELGWRDPDLVILAYGTNEGFDDDLEPARYRAAFSRQLNMIEAAAPDAALLIVGPPDANRRLSVCRPDDEEAEDPLGEVCAPLSASEAVAYAEVFNEDAEGEACRWHPPPNLERVRAVQRQVAGAEGAYFWDWSRVMGGECGANRWATAEPPLAYGDRVHLRGAGYARSADALFDTLMAQYAGWQAGRAIAGLPGF